MTIAKFLLIVLFSIVLMYFFFAVGNHTWNMMQWSDKASGIYGICTAGCIFGMSIAQLILFMDPDEDPYKNKRY